MDTITQTKEILIEGDETRGYRLFDAADGERLIHRGQHVQSFAVKEDAENFKRIYLMRDQDPQPWILPATGERFALEQEGRLSIHKPRLVWPTHGGRMVRRDYLRPGDRAVSSHYGPRIVSSVLLAGDSGQTTQISWVATGGASRELSERYDSQLMIELLEG